MRIAILGGTGFIGTNLSLLLQEKSSDEVFLFDNFQMGPQSAKANVQYPITQGDMCNFAELSDFIQRVQPDRIYHLAANSDIQASQSNSQLDVQNTFLSTEVLGHVLCSNPVQELVFASSSAVYGPKSRKISEDEPCNPISSYGWMKLASENVLNKLVERGAIKKLLIARFPNVTGKWQTHGVVYDLVAKLKIDSDRLSVLGNGTQSKPYLLANELVEVITRIISTQTTNTCIINIAPPSNLSVSEIVNQIVEKSLLKPELYYGENNFGWIGDVPRYELDTRKLYELLPDIQLTDSLPAITAAVEWMWEQSGTQ